MNSSVQPTAVNDSSLMAVVVREVDRIISACCIVLAIASLCTMFFSLMVDVGVRYVTNQGLGWPGETPNLLFPWLVMSGVVLAAQRGQHIAVVAVQGFLGRAGNRALLLLLQTLVAATFFYLAYVGLDVIEITGTEINPVTGISASWAYLALIAGFVGLGITAVTTFVRLLLAEDPLSVRAHRIEEEL